MPRFRERLASPNFWVGVFCVLAAIGIVLMLLGALVGARWLAHAGLWLGAPLTVGAVAAFVCSLYLLSLDHRREHRGPRGR